MKKKEPDTKITIGFLSKVINQALKSGADSADALSLETFGAKASQRLEKKEDFERSESKSFGLRVFVDKRNAIASSSDIGKESVDQLISRAVAMAKAAPDDPYSQLAENNMIASNWPELELEDDETLSSTKLYEYANLAENSAMSVHGITNSEGAEASWNKSTIALVTSKGFEGAYSQSSYGIAASVIAGEGVNMQRDYDYAISRKLRSLTDPTKVGKNAGERAVKKLNPRKITSAKIPVVFDWRTASSLLGHFVSAINGQSIARKSSFLTEKLGKKIFPSNVSIVDEPHRISGIASRPFDGEGVKCRNLQLVSEGELCSWILDTTTAKQLNMSSTGHAARSVSGPPSPSPSNLYLEAGKASVEEIIGNIKEGVYVTELIGMGVNIVTGDYSRGAAGFYIKDGKISFPVSEITIAGNLIAMYENLIPANDLEFRYGTNSPTLCVENMTVAGS